MKLLEAVNLFAATCRGSNNTFFGLPTWYRYLSKERGIQGAVDDKCRLEISIDSLQDIWLIGLGILDILLRIVGMVAIGFVIYGGIQYLTSQGEPDRTKAALSTIINAFVGLAISIVASAVVYFIGNSL
jgi:Type IV secretion system pilin